MIRHAVRIICVPRLRYRRCALTLCELVQPVVQVHNHIPFFHLRVTRRADTKRTVRHRMIRHAVCVVRVPRLRYRRCTLALGEHIQPVVQVHDHIAFFHLRVTRRADTKCTVGLRMIRHAVTVVGVPGLRDRACALALRIYVQPIEQIHSHVAVLDFTVPRRTNSKICVRLRMVRHSIRIQRVPRCRGGIIRYRHTHHRQPVVYVHRIGRLRMPRGSQPVRVVHNRSAFGSVHRIKILSHRLAVLADRDSARRHSRIRLERRYRLGIPRRTQPDRRYSPRLRRVPVNVVFAKRRPQEILAHALLHPPMVVVFVPRRHLVPAPTQPKSIVLINVSR